MYISFGQVYDTIEFLNDDWTHLFEFIGFMVQSPPVYLHVGSKDLTVTKVTSGYLKVTFLYFSFFILN